MALTDFLLLDQTLTVFEISLRTVISSNAALIRDLVETAAGQVTTSLFPVGDLLCTLDLRKSKFKLKPLFTEDTIQYYYPLLEAVLTMDAVVIQVP